MDGSKDLLLASAARLYSIGVEVEAARERLRELVAQGVPYDDERMIQAYQDFTALDQQWKSLEQAHLALRDEILRRAADKTE